MRKIEKSIGSNANQAVCSHCGDPWSDKVADLIGCGGCCDADTEERASREAKMTVAELQSYVRDAEKRAELANEEADRRSSLLSKANAKKTLDDIDARVAARL